MREDGRAISFFGDLHPSFAGNVVKAMGGAKLGYPVVSRTLAKRKPEAPAPQQLIATLDDELRPRVHAVVELAPKIVEVIVRAPKAARAFHPGQFYRLQNYESHAPKAAGTSLTMEGLALTGATVDREKGLLSTIVLEMGGSSDLCSILEPGEPVVLMGPTGTPTETPGGEHVVLVGGGLGNAVLLSIGTALRERGSKVLYFAGYKKPQDRYKVKRDRGRGRLRRLVLRYGAGLHAVAAAGQGLRRQYRRGDARLCRRPARRSADRAAFGGSPHRHRLGRHDECGGARARNLAQATS